MARKHRPRVVVSDIRLPDFDGYELCKRMKGDAELENIPVVLITSMFYESDREEAATARGKKKAESVGAYALLPRGEAVDGLVPLLRRITERKKR